MGIVTIDIFVEVEEMKESVKIINQCLVSIPKGPVKSLRWKTKSTTKKRIKRVNGSINSPF